jgi:ATP-dependent protease ClpP protease subunit
MAEIIAFHSGQPLDKVERDIDRDFFMTAEEAKHYGLIDEIIVPTRGLCAPRSPEDRNDDLITAATGRVAS